MGQHPGSLTGPDRKLRSTTLILVLLTAAMGAARKQGHALLQTRKFWSAESGVSPHCQPAQPPIVSMLKRPPSRLTVLSAGIILVLMVAALGLWAFVEKWFVYFPETEFVNTPGQLGLPYEDVFLETEDGLTLHGWYVPGKEDVTWLWFHGNGGNISHRLDEAALFRHALGVNQFLFDYRGYGRSQGKPSESGAYLDARAALAYLHSRSDVDPRRVVYFGRSLGTAIAVELATAHEPLGLVLVAPFTSLSDMARLSFSFPPLHLLVRGRYDSLDRIARTTSPLLIVHGDSDQTIPVDQGRRLFEAANEPKRFLALPGADHNDTYITGGRLYWDAMKEFLESVSGAGGAD